ncbi:MAG: class I SAM-dependent methyltransferase [Candidatus Kapaibacterium sp.]|jgi:SAM-dependent methyltransferase
MWYNHWFKDSNYTVVYDHRDDEEAEQMLELVERVTGRDQTRSVLDLACGSGRHALSFARRGYQRVTGVDLSETLLAKAELCAKEESLSVTFAREDMRRFPIGDGYDLILNLFTSFGYFQLDEENEEVLARVASALNSDGWFVLDFLNPDWVRTHLVAHDERMLPDGGRVEQTRWIEKGRVEKRLLIRHGEEAQEFFESVRLFQLSDFLAMFERCGLRLSATFGNYGGAPFQAGQSNRLIMFVTK